MTSDPKRFLSTTGEAHELERGLMRGLRDVAAPPGAKAETWTRLQAQLAATAAVAAGVAAAQSAGKAAIGRTVGEGAASAQTGWADSATLRTVAIKLGLGVLVAGSIVGGAVALWPRGTPSITSRAIVPAADAPTPPVTPLDRDPRTVPVLPTDNPRSSPAVRPDSRPTHARRPESAVAPDPLAVEAAMITEARAQLRGGDARAALATLGNLQSRSRNGALGQEREILTIQALAATGETEAARRRARAFVASYPDSPHAAQMRGVARGP